MSGCMSAMGGMAPGELSKGLKQLKGEHPPLLAQLEEIFKCTQLIEEAVDIEKNFSDLISKVNQFKEELDPHSEREEGVLFPMMGAYIGTTSGPIAVMEYEHDQAKMKINAFLEQASSGEHKKEEIQNLSALIKEAYFILTQHFSKEENVLFPMAERMLSEEEKEELFRKIQEI